MKPTLPVKKSSMAQRAYLEILFNDCGFDRHQKQDWLQTGYKVNYTDELTNDQAGQIIRYLKDLKVQQRSPKLKL